MKTCKVSYALAQSNLSTMTTLGTSKKMAVVDRWLVCQGFSMKIAIYFGLARLRLAIVDRWSLFRLGCISTY
jgi:hypothetical protein